MKMVRGYESKTLARVQFSGLYSLLDLVEIVFLVTDVLNLT